MKILFITNSIYGHGGLERVLSVKASKLTDFYNYEVHVASISSHNSTPFYNFSPNIRFHNIELSKNKILYSLQYIYKIRRLISKLSPDIIDVCDDGFKASILPLLHLRHNYVYERHISTAVDSRTIYTFIKHKIAEFCLNTLYDKVILLSEAHKKEWKLKNAVVIPNMTPFRADKIKSPKDKQIIAVGKVSKQKAYMRLLLVWEKLYMDFPDWEVNIFGPIHAAEELNEYIQTKCIKRFNLKGSSKDIFYEYSTSSIHVMTSIYEGLPMAIIEAQSCGVPSVAFDCPYGPKELINHKINGFLVPDGDINQFADYLRQLISSETTRCAMGKAAYQDSEKYDWKAILESWVKLYTQILNSKL